MTNNLMQSNHQVALLYIVYNLSLYFVSLYCVFFKVSFILYTFSYYNLHPNSKETEKPRGREREREKDNRTEYFKRKVFFLHITLYVYIFYL